MTKHFGSARLLEWGGLKYLLAALLGTLALTLGVVSPAQAKLQNVGPVDPSNGFPYWYEDESGTRLDLCLDPQDQMCLQPFEMPDPTAGKVSFPQNFPAEAFWWTGEASMTMTNGADALLVMAQEAAFANEEPVDGDQATFGRIRIRVGGLEAGQRYRITHPYGTDNYVASGTGVINVTEDVGCILPTQQSPCQFGENGHTDESLSSRIGPFLRWDEGAPEGYLGDPNITHTVTGSPNNTNFFKVERLNADGSVAEVLGQTDQFAISGKIATPQVNASPRQEVFNAPRDITLVPSDASSYEVYYTTDGTDPSDPTNASRHLYTAPIHLEGIEGELQSTTLRFVAIDPATAKSSALMEKSYTIDRQAPSLSAADPAGGTYNTPQSVTLSTGDANDKIYYTTDGSTPTTASNEYTSAIEVGRSQTIKAIAIDPVGNQSQIETYRYTIASLAATGPINPQGGFPFWYEDASGLKLDLCLDPQDQKCLQPFEMPNPDGKVSFPQNFPAEAFWWTGEASTTTTTGADALLVMAQEAAFANEEPVDGDQMSFGRVRVRVDGLRAGQTYRITHPYGTDNYVASGTGVINVTQDIGCQPSAQVGCDFDAARFGRVGPFLTWTTFGNATDNDPTTVPDPALMGLDATGQPDPNQADAYVGDPTVESGHQVKGSPYGTNFFKVERIRADGSVAETVASTDMFAISGKVAKLEVGASKVGGSYDAPQDVSLGASEPNATIYYTTDGTEPTTSSTTYTQPLHITESTTLKFMAVDAAGNSSQVYTETYTMDTQAPGAPTVSLEAASDSGLKGDGITSDTTPTFVGTAEAGSTVKVFSSNGIEQGSAVADASGAYSLTTISPLGNGAPQLSFTATDQAGNQSAPTTMSLTIDNVAPAAPTANPPGGTYSSAQSVSLTTTEAGAQIRYTTNGSAPSDQSTLYSAPITVASSQTINAIAIDAAGNRSAARSFAYVINTAPTNPAPTNTAPTITSMSPADGSTTRDKKVTITATVRDAQTNLAAANIRVLVDGNQVSTFTYNQNTDLLTYRPPRNFALGQHTVQIVATDAQGLATSRTWSFTVVTR